MPAIFARALRIDGIKKLWSRGIWAGKQLIKSIKSANTINRGRVCLLSQNLTSNVQLELSKFFVVIVCCEDIYGRFWIQKSNNDHLYLWVAIIVCKIKSYYFLLSAINKLDRDFLNIGKF